MDAEVEDSIPLPAAKLQMLRSVIENLPLWYPEQLEALMKSILMKVEDAIPFLRKRLDPYVLISDS